MLNFILHINLLYQVISTYGITYFINLFFHSQIVLHICISSYNFNCIRIDFCKSQILKNQLRIRWDMTQG